MNSPADNTDNTQNTEILQTDTEPEKIPGDAPDDNASEDTGELTIPQRNEQPDDFKQPETDSGDHKQPEPAVHPEPETAVQPKKFSLFHAIQIVSGASIGAAMGYLILYLLIPRFFTLADFFRILVFIVLSLFINLNVYNLGRLIAGYFSGGTIISWQLVCLRFFRKDGIMRRFLTPHHVFQGQCTVLPPSGKPLRDRIYILFYAGSIAACAVVGCVCIITATVLPAAAPVYLLAGGQYRSLLLFLWVHFAVTFAYTVGCLLPVFWGDCPSDGIILYALFTKSPYAVTLIKLRDATRQLSDGIRPSNIHIPVIFPVRIIKKKPEKTTPSLVRKLSDRIAAYVKDLKAFLIKNIRSLRVLLSNGPVARKAVVNTEDAQKAAEITDLPPPDGDESGEQEETEETTESTEKTGSETVPVGAVDTASAGTVDAVKTNGTFDGDAGGSPENKKAVPRKQKLGVRLGVLRYKIKLILLPAVINRPDPEIEPFPEPAKDDICAYELLLKLYEYYIALDNAENADIRKHLMIIEENINKVPRQMLRRVWLELCFYYSITKNAAAAAGYMEMAERQPEAKKQTAEMRVRAYYEMYINRRYKTAFSLCRNVTESAAECNNGLTVMNRELVKGLLILMHQRNISKNE